MTQQHTITVINTDGDEQVIEVADGANLRRSLLDAGISPYTSITTNLNCGGRGICATCGVWIDANEPAPEHWHDRIGSRFGYPRLSCQVSVEADLTVRLVDKWIWGAPDRSRRSKPSR